jgi:nucleoside-diphosphate-sugar epimerase
MTSYPRVLVIGGTRFIGPAVVRRLLKRRCEVALFNRGQTGSDLFADLPNIQGDCKEIRTYSAQFADFAPDVVIDMMLVTEADARGLIDTFKGLAHRVVAISSCDVYRAYGRMIGLEPGPPDPTPLTEDSPLRETLYPYRGKIERLHDYDKIPIEKVVLSGPELQGTVMRLPMVYGPRDYQHRLFPYLKRIDDGRTAILLEQPVAEWRSCRGFVENVAEAIVTAACDDRAARRIYNVAEEHNFTELEWVKQIAQTAGWNGDVVVVPKGQQPDHSVEDFDPQHHLSVDSSRIRMELGYREPVGLEAALKETIAWEREHPPEQIVPAQFDYEAEDRVLANLDS